MADLVISPPAIEPVTRAQVKAHLRATGTSEDTLIDQYTAAARRHIETWCRRALVKQTRRLVLDRFPGVIELPVAPLRSVQSIKYLDDAGAQQTLSSSRYRVSASGSVPRIKPAYGDTWPTTYDVDDAVEITYVAGHLLPFTAATDTDTLTCAGHGHAAGDLVQVATLGGTLPGGLSAATDYFVVSPAANTLQLALTAGGAAIDITSAGTAPNVVGFIDPDILSALYLLIGHLHEHREEASEIQLFHMPLAAERLLAPHRIVRF